MFQQQLDHLFRTLDGGDGMFALHCLDLDQFKVINDTLGHPAGDTLLIEAGQRVQNAARGHFVARLGGDEFVVLQTVGEDRDAIDRLARESSRRSPSRWSSTATRSRLRPASASPSRRRTARDGETLLRNADLALYRAKEAGRGTYAFFEESLNQRAQQRHQLETDLRLALERDEFELYYQPLFDLEHNRICSFEALLRWNHPTRGMISPADFIPIAEDTGLIVPIGAWVIREACAQAAGLARACPRRGQRLAGAVSPRRASTRPSCARSPTAASRRTGSRSRSPNRSSSKAAKRRSGCSTRCARSASASRSTISAPAIRRSAICRASRSTSSRSTAASSTIC